MLSLVQIAYNTIQGFGLSDSDKQNLVDMLQGDEMQVVEKQARKKLKKLSKEEIESLEMEKWLIENHFRSQNGKSILK